jgi:hypothetical protein
VIGVTSILVTRTFVCQRRFDALEHTAKIRKCPLGHGTVSHQGCTVTAMKIMRTAALAGVAKKLYDEARKPENQAKMKQAAEKVRKQVEQRRRKH